MRRLVVMRHAKAVATAPSDHERGLAARGRADAEEVAAGCASGGSSPTPRSSPTRCGPARPGSRSPARAGWDLEADFSAALYAAGSDSAFDLVRETDAGVQTLVVVGHNPTMAYIAELSTTARVTPRPPRAWSPAASPRRPSRSSPSRPTGPTSARAPAASRPSTPATVTDPLVVARLRAAGCVWAEDEAAALEQSAATPDELEALVARRVGGRAAGDRARVGGVPRTAAGGRTRRLRPETAYGAAGPPGAHAGRRSGGAPTSSLPCWSRCAAGSHRSPPASAGAGRRCTPPT